MFNQHLMDIQPSLDVAFLLQPSKSRDLAFGALCLIHAVSFSDHRVMVHFCASCFDSLLILDPDELFIYMLDGLHG